MNEIVRQYSYRNTDVNCQKNNLSIGQILFTSSNAMKSSVTVVATMGFTTEEKRFTNGHVKKQAAKC